MSHIETFQLDCGMPLVVEPVPNVDSVALNWVLPAGSATDPVEGDGYAALLCELIQRGACGLSSREHSDALDRLGVQRGADVQTHHMRVDATLVGSRLADALPLIVGMVRSPALPADALDAVRSLALQSLDSLNDEPHHRVMLRVRERHYAPPFNRHGYGERNVLESATIDALRESWQRRFRPGGSIMGVAGAVNPRQVADQLNRLLDTWNRPRPRCTSVLHSMRLRNATPAP